MSHYLLTGASGFVGRHLLDRLLAAGHRVAAVARRADWIAAASARPECLRKGDAPPALTLFQGDLADPGFVERIWEKEGSFDAVLHFAAMIPADIKGVAEEFTYAQYIHNNVTATATLLDTMIRRRQRPPFIYASSISVFGRVDRLPLTEDHPTCPADIYGLSKLQGEEVIRLAAASGAVRAVVLRYPGMIGIGNDYGAVHFFITRVMAGQPISVYGHGRPRKDYIAVEDVAEAALRALEHADKFDFEIFHIGGCAPGVPPAPLVEVARWVAEACGGGKVETNDRPPAQPENMYFDNVKAHNLLGYTPVPLADRVRKYVALRKASGK